jgi:hypothetical protein
MTKSLVRKDITSPLRSRICELHRVNGLGSSQIPKLHPELKRDAIKKTLKKIKSRDKNQPCPRTDPVPILIEKDSLRIIETPTYRPSTYSEETPMVVGDRCGKLTLQQLFQELNIRK